MTCELSQDTPHVTFVDRDQEVEALAPYRTFKSFAKRIRRGARTLRWPVMRLRANAIN
jgi:hypothetical protein